MPKTKQLEKIPITCHKRKCKHEWKTATKRRRVTCPECGANVKVPGNENNLPPKREGKYGCPACTYRWTPKTKSERLTCPWCAKSLRKSKLKERKKRKRK